MENVAEMANAFEGAFREEIEARFAEFGYKVEYQVHNAAEHGVPQRRRRVVFLASRTGVLPALPRPKCQVGLSDGTHMAGGAPTGSVSVWDAIGDLSPVREGRGTGGTYASEPFSAYQRMMRSACASSVTDHVERKLQPTQQARYDALAPGEGLRELPDHLRPNSGYSGAYGRLTKEMIAPTITRWCFHPGSGRFGHPVEQRILTIRELARLQSFSDDFRFSGTNQQKSWQVGNAVPPLLAEAFAQEIARVLKGEAQPTVRLAKKPAPRLTENQLTLFGK
jgi:DNA (cytosine-5)-methyltransferase 1